MKGQKAIDGFKKENAQLRKEIEELEKTSNIIIALLEEEKDKLRKENEELKEESTLRESIIDSQRVEITRLTELLRRMVKIWKDDDETTLINLDHAFIEADKYLTEIEKRHWP